MSFSSGSELPESVFFWVFIHVIWYSLCYRDTLDSVDKTVCVAHGLRVEFGLHREPLQTKSCLLHDSALFAVAHSLFLHLKLAVEEDFFLFVLDDEGRFGNGVAVAIATCTAHHRLLLVSFLIGCLRIWLAVEDHLLPRLKLFEDRKDFAELWVVCL